MPYTIRKKKCRQSDGDSGSYILSYTTKKGEHRSNCHTSKKRAQGQIAAIEAEGDTALDEIRARGAIRAGLREAARTAGQLPYGVCVLVDDYGGAIEFYYGNPEGQRIMEPINGFLAVEYNDICRSWTIESSEADRGWGPLLYDIAMEWVTQMGSSLAPDRGSVSPLAQKVWHYYFYRRDDVDAALLPQVHDCLPATVSQSDGVPLDMTDDPLWHTYRKSSTTIDALRAKGKLIEL